MTASRIIGDYIGDLIGEDEDELADLIGDADGGEVGRRMRRGQRRRASRGMRRLGVTREDLARVRMQAQREKLRAIEQEAAASGEQLTAGHYVADGGGRKLYLPFSADIQVPAAAGSVGVLVATVQRPMTISRLIIDALDETTRADDLNTYGVTNVSIGVQPVFNAQGVAPAVAFRQNTVGNQLETMVARVGMQVTVQLRRIVAGANAGRVSGYIVGISADN